MTKSAKKNHKISVVLLEISKMAKLTIRYCELDEYADERCSLTMNFEEPQEFTLYVYKNTNWLKILVRAYSQILQQTSFRMESVDNE